MFVKEGLVSEMCPVQKYLIARSTDLGNLPVVIEPWTLWLLMHLISLLVEARVMDGERKSKQTKIKGKINLNIWGHGWLYRVPPVPPLTGIKQIGDISLFWICLIINHFGNTHQQWQRSMFAKYLLLLNNYDWSFLCVRNDLQIGGAGHFVPQIW